MNEGPRHRPKHYIPHLTPGKIQLKPILDVLRFDRALINDISAHNLLSMVREHKDFSRWLAQSVTRGRKGEKLIEAATSDDGRYLAGGKRVDVSPADTRAVICHLFSRNQRGGGSRISSFALIEVDSKKCVGLETAYSHQKEVLLENGDAMNGISLEDGLRLSGYHIKIGRPYAKIISQVTSLIAKAIDRVSANLTREVDRRKDDKETIEVEPLSVWCCKNLGELMAVPNRGGRFISKVDFFIFPPAELREKVLKSGSMNQTLKKELRHAMQKGQFCLSVFDISAGSAGIGISDILARHWGFTSPGHLEIYIDNLLCEYHRMNASMPTQVVIMPSAFDLKSFASVEYVPLCTAFRERGYRCHIALSDAYQETLAKKPSPVRFKSIDGHNIVIGGDERTLIVRRYTYLHEGNGCSHGVIPRHPIRTTVLPSDESRIVASDCRVNLRLLERATKPLTGNMKRRQGGSFQIMPYIIVSLKDTNAAYTAQGFLASCKDRWPEVTCLGGVLKPADKVPISGAGVVKSTYPLPPVPTSRHVIDIMVKPLFHSLHAKGVDEIVVMPNVLPLVVDQNDNVLPKFEVRMISLFT